MGRRASGARAEGARHRARDRAGCAPAGSAAEMWRKCRAEARACGAFFARTSLPAGPDPATASGRREWIASADAAAFGPASAQPAERPRNPRGLVLYGLGPLDTFLERDRGAPRA
jgi:hypothetical protein